MKAMQMKPVHRHQSAAEFIDDLLGGKADDEVIVTPPVPPVPPASVKNDASNAAKTALIPADGVKEKKSSLLWLWILLAILALIAAAGAFYLISNKPDQKEVKSEIKQDNTETVLQTADSTEAQALVTKLQTHITENYYNCTDEILAGVGKMYVADERFKKNIDKYGEGTAEFASKAISIRCG